MRAQLFAAAFRVYDCSTFSTCRCDSPTNLQQGKRHRSRQVFAGEDVYNFRELREQTDRWRETVLEHRQHQQLTKLIVSYCQPFPLFKLQLVLFGCVMSLYRVDGSSLGCRGWQDQRQLGATVAATTAHCLKARLVLNIEYQFKKMRLKEYSDL